MKKIVSFVLAIALIVCLPNTAFLVAKAQGGDESRVACSGENIKSYCGISAYEEEITSLSDSTDSVAWADISISDSEHVISFSMLSDEMAVETFTGQVFALHGNGYYDDRLILGSFSPVENHNIALFKILNENIPELTLLVEDMFTGELKEYRFEISQEKFSALMNVAKKTTALREKELADSDDNISSDLLVAQEVISLMQPQNNYISAPAKNGVSPLAQSNSSFKSTNSYSAVAATADELKAFCTNINNSPSVGITPSATIQSVLSQTGWKMYKTSSYFYVMHGVANTSTDQLVGITVASVSQNKPEDTKISANITIIGSCTVAYNKVTKVATLLQYNTGIRLEDAIIAIELVGGTTNFYEATRSFKLEDNNSGVKEILIAISSKLGVASAIWNALKSSEDSSETVQFGTDRNQELVYGGLVRAVANSTASGKYLWGKDCSLGISACHYDLPQKNYSSHRIAYGFTGYSLL